MFSLHLPGNRQAQAAILGYLAFHARYAELAGSFARVGAANGDPYPEHADAIKTLGDYFGIKLERARCYPYRR